MIAAHKETVGSFISFASQWTYSKYTKWSVLYYTEHFSGTIKTYLLSYYNYYCYKRGNMKEIQSDE